MSKKRKTRKEKEALRKHTFSHIEKPTTTKTVINEKGEEKEIMVQAENQLPAYIITDLKKVMLVTGSIIVFVLVMWLVVFHTTWLDGVLNIFNIKY